MPTKEELQELAEKYRLTRSGSKTQLAKRIYHLRSTYLSQKERKMLEDFLHMPNREKDTDPRKRLPKQ